MIQLMPREEKPVMTVSEVAELLGLGTSTVRREALREGSRISAARLPGISARVLRFRRCDIEELVYGRRADVLPMRGAR